MSYTEKLQRCFDQTRLRSEICVGEEYSKYTKMINQMFDVFMIYRPSTTDKIIFCQIYDLWVNAYLKCCALNMKREYLSAVLQDTYHTYKAEISE